MGRNIAWNTNTRFIDSSGTRREMSTRDYDRQKGTLGEHTVVGITTQQSSLPGKTWGLYCGHLPKIRRPKLNHRPLLLLISAAKTNISSCGPLVKAI